MTYHHELTPTGRIYRRRADKTHWTVELEIGGAVWLRCDDGQIITARAEHLQGWGWERIA